MSQPNTNALFERSITLPDSDARDRLARLVGMEDKIKRLTNILSVLINPHGLQKWQKDHHPDAPRLMDSVLRRPPLVVLSGDVGSGKTELAETIGDPVARQEDIDITLLPMSLSSRGQGRVGEMTQLVTAAFEHAYAEASKLKSAKGAARGGVILLVDEADALAQSRETEQMHHEDRAGVNAFIRGIDRLASGRLPAAVIMCTNRLSALDPAVRRRAADVLTGATCSSAGSVRWGSRRPTSKPWSRPPGPRQDGPTGSRSPTWRRGCCRRSSWTPTPRARSRPRRRSHWRAASSRRRPSTTRRLAPPGDTR